MLSCMLSLPSASANGPVLFLPSGEKVFPKKLNAHYGLVCCTAFHYKVRLLGWSRKVKSGGCSEVSLSLIRSPAEERIAKSEREYAYALIEFDEGALPALCPPRA